MSESLATACTLAGAQAVTTEASPPRPSVPASLQRSRAIKRWQHMRTLIKINRKKRTHARTSSPALLTCRDGAAPTNALIHPLHGRSLFREKSPPVRKRSENLEEADTPLKRFRRAARLLQILQRVSNSIIRFSRDTHLPELSSLAGFQDDLDGLGALRNSGLVFDPAYFKVQKEVQLSTEVKRILTKYPSERTADEVHLALIALKNAVQAFDKFPIKMQESLAMVGWYESFDDKRVIIRQGHKAESFYLMLSGTSVVTISSRDTETSEPTVRRVAFLKRGNSFGELALMHHSTRQATVYCEGTVELLSIGREDFKDIFMHRNEGMEPEFIRYLRTIDELKGWPVYRLPHDKPSVCLFTYFRRGVVICKDSNTSDWIYVVKTGTCRVLKKLKAPKRLFKARADLMNVFEMTHSDKQQSAKVSTRKGSHQCCVSPPPRQARSRKESSQSSKYARLPNIAREPQTRPAAFSAPILQVASAAYTNEVETHLNEIQGKIDRLQLEPQECASQAGERAVFIQVQKLTERETFGLHPLVFGERECAPSVTLVSDGAECVLVSKRFFLQHLSEDHKKSLRRTLRPYPSEARLQEKLQEQTDWDEFKLHTMQKLIDRHSHKTPLPHFSV
ncbi:cyclic nucleotide-binding domain-containing protein 2-like isoform X2 [Acanthaster planci]|uniref:Cyclic nucleotide-binding domain-containing protein 2-like isoform X2 n=1 Tax=Acanthaster planci TaxID=133434 RepID=A0A8B7XFQ2_ACAPL|nr:cyclic nucleotide-binding domain-containing protein 2-like isoform X2 [Acanthaster planci]